MAAKQEGTNFELHDKMNFCELMKERTVEEGEAIPYYLQSRDGDRIWE